MQIREKGLVLELRSAWSLSWSLINSDNLGAVLNPALSYQSSPIPVGSEMLSALAHEIQVRTQESPHFIRIKDDSEFGSGGIAEPHFQGHTEQL